MYLAFLPPYFSRNPRISTGIVIIYSFCWLYNIPCVNHNTLYNLSSIVRYSLFKFFGTIKNVAINIFANVLVS